MTNKEAIKVLESTDGVLPKNPFVSDVKLKKALTLAIKALEWQYKCHGEFDGQG